MQLEMKCAQSPEFGGGPRAAPAPKGQNSWSIGPEITIALFDGNRPHYWRKKRARERSYMIGRRRRERCIWMIIGGPKNTLLALLSSEKYR